MTEASTRIKNLVANDQLDLALNELEKYAVGINDKYMNQISILKGNLKDIKSRSTLGVLEVKEEQLLLNKIRLSIVQTLDSIESYAPSDTNKKQKKYFIVILIFIALIVFWGLIIYPKEEINLSNLFEIIDSPIQDKEIIILSRGFSNPKQIEFGKSYSRNYETEFIEKWDNGIVRYITKNETKFQRIARQIPKEGFKYIESDASPNEKGDLIFDFEKGAKKITVGSFSKAQMYMITVSDTTKQYEIKPYVESKDFLGTWGRIQESGKEGVYTFNKDNSFIYIDSEFGAIKGGWNIENRELILKYNFSKDIKSSIKSSHPLSGKTEIIKIIHKTPTFSPNEFECEIQGKVGELGKIVLKRR